MAEPQGMHVEGGPPAPGNEFPRAPLGPSVTWTLGMPEALDRHGGQHVLSRSESCLLLKRQRINQRFDIPQFAAPVLSLWYDENVIFDDYKKYSGLPQGVPTVPVDWRSGAELTAGRASAPSAGRRRHPSSSVTWSWRRSPTECAPEVF